MLWHVMPGHLAQRAAIDAAVGVADPVSYLATVSNGGSVNIGTADPNCLVIAIVTHTRSTTTGRQINSVTIGGTGATIHVQVGNNATSGAGIGIASATVTGGGSIAVSWVLSGAISQDRAMIYKVITANTSPGNTGSANGNDPSATVNTTAGGFMIAGLSGAGSASNGMSTTWTNASKDIDGSTTVSSWSGAHTYNNSAVTGQSVTGAVATTNEVIALAAWPSP